MAMATVVATITDLNIVLLRTILSKDKTQSVCGNQLWEIVDRRTLCGDPKDSTATLAHRENRMNALVQR